MQFANKGQSVAYRSFCVWLGKEAELSDLTMENLQCFAKSKHLARLTKKSRTTYIASMRAILRKFGQLPTDQAMVLPDEVEGQLTLWGLFERHYKPRRLIGKSHNTVRLYRTSVRKFSEFLGRPAMLTDLTDEAVARYLDYLTGRISMQSVVKEYDQLLAIWRFASRRRLVETFPDLTRPIAPKPVPDAFTHDELNQLIAAARAWDGYYHDIPAGLWWEAMIRVVYDTGERIGAILKIQPQHVQGEWVLIPAQSRKGGHQGKRFKVSPKTAEMLAEIASQQTRKSLFAWPKSYTYFWKIFGELIESAGLPNTRRGKWHKIRRSVATFYEAKGGNATELLGHSSRRVTEAYLDTRFIEKAHPCDLIEPL